LTNKIVVAIGFIGAIIAVGVISFWSELASVPGLDATSEVGQEVAYESGDPLTLFAGAEKTPEYCVWVLEQEEVQNLLDCTDEVVLTEDEQVGWIHYRDPTLRFSLRYPPA